jgi:hypothetical protein
MLKLSLLVSVLGVAALLLPGGAFALPVDHSPFDQIGSPHSGKTSSGSIAVGNLKNLTSVPPAFWGVNVAAANPFTKTDGSNVAATPVTYVRFPGGRTGEEFNYTSGQITQTDGTHQQAATSTATFVASCKSFGCQAIMQLPAEINAPKTAAYYASYVVHTLHYQPKYWEIGNAPSGWTHFGVPWSKWGNSGGGNITPVPFANLVKAYIQAVKAVDPGAQFLALGSWIGLKNYDKPWVTELAKVDGHDLAGISVHSYLVSGPHNPTWAQLFANLQGPLSLTAQVPADRAFIKAACSTCTKLDVFVSEINAAEVSPYNPMLSTFAGSLYLAAETVQGLSVHAANLDWFAYDSDFSGAWETHPGKWQTQYYLFTDIMPHLQNGILPTTVKGPSTFYAIATYNSSGLSVLMVNVNMTSSVSVDLSKAGFVMGTHGSEYLWKNGVSRTVKSSITLSQTFTLPPLSIALLSVPAKGAHIPGDPTTVVALGNHAAPGAVSLASGPAVMTGALGHDGSVAHAIIASPIPGQTVSLAGAAQRLRYLP